MSWWVYLKCPHCAQPLPVDSHEEGGTYVAGGTNTAELNITYNYSSDFYRALAYEDGFAEWLNNKVAGDVISNLESAVAVLGTRRTSDYWEVHPGNAGYALNILLTWAKQHPTGLFEVD